MKLVQGWLWRAFIAGALVLLPIYLALLLVLKAMQTVAGLIRPIAKLLPAWVPAETVLSLLAVLALCMVVGVIVRTPAGNAFRERLDKKFFERVPGYALFRSLTQQLAGNTDGQVWHPALVEIEDALVPAFIIEELDDGRYTIFVPSVPTPLAGTVYVLARDRVHPIDVPFTQAVKAVSQWGSGAKDLVAAMESHAQRSKAAGAR
jgi:uncharacterized membrane protein